MSLTRALKDLVPAADKASETSYSLFVLELEVLSTAMSNIRGCLLSICCLGCRIVNLPRPPFVVPHELGCKPIKASLVCASG